MQRRRTWREVLADVIRDPQEKQRIAHELRINPITLVRWVNRQARPRPQNLQQLVKAIPQYYEDLLPSLAEEFADVFGTSDEQRDDTSQEIPSEFYARVLRAYASTPPILRSSSIYALILQQALGHLDPNKLGMSITVVRCTPPAPGQKVRSLRESLGRGTPPWKSRLENQALLLGAESLAGYAVSSFRLVINQNIRAGTSFFPVLRTEWEESAAACPLLQVDRVAGCLLVASTQLNYFSPARQALIQNYTDLMLLACESEEFYEQSNIALGIMPPSDMQQSYFAHFKRSVTNMMIRTAQEGRPITRTQAEELVWHELEEKLLQE